MTLTDVAQPRSRSVGFRADLQGLRAVAVALVVIYHTGYAMPGGFIGVDVFFVLSGFLIIGLLDREAERTGRIDLKAFFARRARRLLPALAVVTSVTVVLSAAVVELGDPLRAVTRTAIGASLFVANGVLYVDTDYFAPAAERNPLLHMWSLSVEEQFYFVAPIALALVLALHRSQRLMGGLSRRRAWVLLLAVGSLVSLVLNIAIVDFSVPVPGLAQSMSFAYYAPITRAWQFGAGGLFALAVAGTRGNTHFPSLRTPGITIVIGAALLLDAGSAFPGVRAVLPTFGTLLLLVPGQAPAGRADKLIVRVLTSRSAVVIGDLSYGWYLWHWPAIVLGRAAFGDSPVTVWAAVLVSLGLAMASSHIIENRFRADSQILGMRALRLVVVCATVPAVIASGAEALNSRIGGLAGLDDGNRPWSRAQCHFPRDTFDAWPSQFCVRPQDADAAEAKIDVLLIGDSHAVGMSEGLLAATEALGLSLGVWTVSGQPPVGDNPWTSRFLEVSRRERPEIIVIATRSTVRFDKARVSRWTNTSLTDDATVRAWEEAVREGVTDLRDLGAHVIWVLNVPEFTQAPRSFLDTSTVLRPNQGRSVDLVQVAEQRDPAIAAELTALSSLERVLVLDPANHLCRPDCRNLDGETFLYYDSNHLTVAGSRLLADMFVQGLTDILDD